MVISGICVGLVFGSFLNVLIHRLPRDQSPWSGRSRCPNCRRQVRWFENVPVVSWAFLLGRCAGCKKPISFRYPLVEIATGLLAWLCLNEFGLTGVAASYFVFLAILLAIAFIDWEHMIIPDELSLGMTVVGILLAVTVLPLGLAKTLLGVVSGAGFIWAIAVFYKKTRGVEGMGFGDVKLAAMIGAFLGPLNVLFTIFLASVLGSVYGAVLMARGGHRQSMVAFGTFLAVSAGIALFYGERFAHWYLSLLQR